MKVKPVDAENPVAVDIPEIPIAEESVSMDSTAKPPRNFVLRIDDDGNLDMSSMRERTKEQLKTLLRDPQIISMMGTGPQPKEISRMFEPEWAGTLLDGLMVVEQIVVQKMTKLPSEICSKAFKLTASEREMASPILAKIVDKYVDKYKIDFVKEFKEEIVLVIMLSAMTKTKLAYARELEMQSKRSRTISAIDGERLQEETQVQAGPVQ